MKSHAKASSAGPNSAIRTSTSLRALPALLALAIGALLLTPALASAALEHAPRGIFGSAAQPTFTGAAGMAVDQSSGDLLAIDTEAGKLSRYHEDGTPSEFSGQGGSNSISIPFELIAAENQVAVDNSGGPGEGNIYVAHRGNGIDMFDADGNSLGELTESSEGPLSACIGVTVDPLGNLYVSCEEKIYKYEPAGAVPAKADNVASFSFPGAAALAAGVGPSAGFIFATHIFSTSAKLDDTTGVEAYEVDPGSFDETLAVNPANGHLFIAGGESIREYNAAGPSPSEVSSTFLGGSSGRGVAVEGSTGDFYVTRLGSTQIEVFPSEATPEYELTIDTSTGTGTGEVECEVEASGTPEACAEKYLEGTKLALVPVPAEHSHFREFEAGTGSAQSVCEASASCEFEIAEDTSVKAPFDLNTHTLTVQAEGEGEVSATTGSISGCEEAGGTCSGSYAEASTVTLEATPGAGKKAVWSGCTSAVGDTCEIEIPNSNATIEVAFEDAGERTLSLSVSGAGSVSAVPPPAPVSGGISACAAGPSGECEAIYLDGQTVKLQASTAPHRKLAWSVSGAAATTCTVAGTSPCTITIGSGPVTVTATNAPITHTIAITNAGTGTGTVECKFGAGPFESCAGPHNEGEAVEVKATAAAHSTFAGYSSGTGSASSCSTSPCSFSLEADSALTATFTHITHTIGVTNVGTGTGTVQCKFGAGSFESCAGPHNEGEAVEVKATPAAHSTFAGFSAGTGSASTCSTSPCSFTLEADSTLTATFTQITHTFALTQAGTGTATVECKEDSGAFSTAACAAPFNEGHQVTIKVTPAAHNAFKEFKSGTGSAVSCNGITATECSFTIEADSALTEETNKITHTFAVTKAGNGVGAIACKEDPAGAFGTCAKAFNEGHQVTIKVTPAAHNTFAGYSAAGGSATPCEGVTAKECSFTIEVDSALTATINKTTHTLGVTLAGSGSGTVECKVGTGSFGACSGQIDEGSKVEVKATAASGSTFAGFSAGTGSAGSCTASPCSITLEADSSLTATFNANPSGGGGGSTPAPAPAPAPAPTPAPTPTPKPLKCKKGFVKKKVHGKAKCVKVKKHKGRKRGGR